MTKYANRGMWFEKAIEQTNKVYKQKDIAQIDKIATPIRYNPRTKQANYSGKSTVDFIGCNNKGQLVAFDAKQTKTKSLPYDNISKHQTDYLRKAKRFGADAFFLVFFAEYNECYKIDINDYLVYKENNARKSIPYDYFVKNAQKIESQNGVAFDYLQ